MYDLNASAEDLLCLERSPFTTKNLDLTDEVNEVLCSTLKEANKVIMGHYLDYIIFLLTLFSKLFFLTLFSNSFFYIPRTSFHLT